MFMYGTNKYGVTRCYADGCTCYCELETSNYECKKQLVHKGYNLYKYLASARTIQAQTYPTTFPTTKTGDLDYQLVALRAECEGKEIFKKHQTSLHACANACRGISQMFMYGTNKYGVTRCYADGCTCYCELETSNYECNKQLVHKGYNLYKYLGPYPSPTTARTETVAPTSGPDISPTTARTETVAPTRENCGGRVYVS